jgi:hypothetical protein
VRKTSSRSPLAKTRKSKYFTKIKGRDSVVDIANSYGLGGPGIESRWGEVFSTSPDRPWGPPNLLYSGYRVFPEGKMAGEWR